MEVRSIKLAIADGKIVGVSLNAQLDSIYKRMFQNACRCARRHPFDVEHGVKVVIFGCFWLEAHCNEQFRDILELETKISEFGTAMWKKFKRVSFFDKLDIIVTISSQTQKNKYSLLLPSLRSLFELRNRLAHFKDEDKLLSESPLVGKALSLIAALPIPIPDINRELMWPKIKGYAQTISQTNAWFNLVHRTYCGRHNLRISRQRLDKKLLPNMLLDSNINE